MNSRQLLLEFADAERLTHAADTLRDSGRWQTEWIGPASLGGDELALALAPRRLARGAIYGGLFAGLGGFALQLYTASAGDPVFPESTFAVVPFLSTSMELAMLGAAIGIVAALLMSTRFPRLFQPRFDAAAFAPGEGDHFFLLVYGEDWQHERVLHLLREQPPLAVHQVADTAAAKVPATSP